MREQLEKAAPTSRIEKTGLLIIIIIIIIIIILIENFDIYLELFFLLNRFFFVGVGDTASDNLRSSSSTADLAAAAGTLIN